MTSDYLTFEELVAQGWSINQGRGMSKRSFTSLSLCLVRNERPVKYVQGYGRTYEEALGDAVHEANTWLKAERIVEFHRESASPSRAGRRRR